MADQETIDIRSNKVTTVLSFAFSVFGIFSYFLFGHFGSHYETPFTGSIAIIAIYWIIALASQLFFIIKVFFDNEVPTESEMNVLALVGPHFSVNNILNFFWCYFFAQENFVLSEIILLVNLFNLILLYTDRKTISFTYIWDWFVVHFAITGIPLAWTIYAIFWNGACLFHSHNESIVARIIANVFIWAFFLIPGILLALFQDASVSLSTSFLMLGLGLGQIFIKSFALQWIFALVISGLDFIGSIYGLVGVWSSFYTAEPIGEQAPLISA